MFAARRPHGTDSGDRASDDHVHQRFVRVIGLPEVEDDEPVPAPPAARAAAPAASQTPESSRAAALAAFDPGRRGVRALAVVAVLAVAVAAVVAWRTRPRVEPVAATVEPASASAAPDAATVVAPPSASPGIVVVAVTGRVRRPGLVRLPAGARVADAVEAAGGVLPDTDLLYVNLARRLVDGELVAIGIPPPPGQATVDPATGPAAPAVVNLNTATVAELETLPGVGPVLAQQIIEYRTRHGRFRSVDELRQVNGVGEARFAQLKSRVTV